MKITDALPLSQPSSPRTLAQPPLTSNVTALPAPPAPGGVASIQKTLAILEIVAERGGATAKEVSASLGYPLPTVYRLMQTLVQSDYLVHIRRERKFELGYKLHQLGVSLHRQIGVPTEVRTEIARLHRSARAAAYFAVYRGADVVVTYIVDSPAAPRLTPLSFGFHEAAHATAFGKIMLSGMSGEQRDQYLDAHGLLRLTPATITERGELERQLESISRSHVAWEHEEFVPGMTCAAVGVRNSAGLLVGSVAISARAATIATRERDLERMLRGTAAGLSRYFRSGSVRR
ncbi:IclR family transcriptional regulator [Cryobacterium breve]|uniref:IclR family transcriptional regulator n=1 Tax=Cryobacterium breve TaxID=1259258 RepID=A0ABY7NF84_9MICO|nr:MULTISPECIES: IclR family transcriptional regulator [Cryobacterium]MDY7541249.1 IclR family transcriptional regulator [Cryobacterium sp. 5B3]MEB0001011.1 IclR family transcriptional regulator [Cryobacterium sp. RTS3]MEB0267895.1 IclR family transcriptional regulator [Cryobacterium sp. 10I5]MEB0276648.1 IclR family transcriptional regulator [Cryobacterium sp. 5B3]WBM80950.1 IclR family transcriptional regulator [Cryobacterium breve]